jgi:Flp pilus assembly pilin Flp
LRYPKNLAPGIGSPNALSVVGYRWGLVIPFFCKWMCATITLGESTMRELTMRTFRKFWKDEQGQDIAEYAVMLAVILVIVIGTVRLIGTNANTVFSQAASSIQ